jgi:alpha-tubulin suppressor-like RCC1 family protein
VLGDGTVKCWGDNGFGQLGDGTTMASVQPVQVLSVSDAVGIAAGFEFSCALIRGGTARCWGEDNDGELGDGIHLPTYVNTPVPKATQVSGLANAIILTGGGSTSDAACALLSDGTVACWGIDISGELGNGVIAAYGDSSTPVVVPDLNGVVSIAGGEAHMCALLSGGTVKCWGGPMGTGADMDVSSPIPVSNVMGATALAAGSGFTCALTSAATIECWGENDYGQLGYPTTATCLNGIPCSLSATAVSSLTGVTALAAGSTHACALLSDRTVRCWGRNDYGQLGNGTTSDSRAPVAVSGLSAVTEIAAGDAHTCARIADGSVRCWGWNSSGQLGNGTTTDSSVPVTVAF